MARQISDVMIAELVDEQSSSSESEIDDSDLDADYRVPNDKVSDEESEESESESDDEIIGSENEDDGETQDTSMDTNDSEPDMFCWTKDLNGFKPKITLPREVEPVVLVDVNRSASELDTFLKLFPMDLFEKIAFYTNMRLQKEKSNSKGKKNPYLDDTSAEEMMIILGCVLVMCYNRVPAMHMYWSTKKSLGNTAISDGVSRNRFQQIFAKLYFADPNKPQDATKTYYLDEILASLKSTFMNARSDSTYQSIDESMTKFKGRSCLKQYMPLKPIKRGIKLWTRCDAQTGYVYDTNIYCGRETEKVEGTLGERVVKKIVEGVRNDAVLIFDRFFTSTNLLNSIGHPAVGTYNKNRKQVAKLCEKFSEKGESEMACCKEGLLCVHWKDTKDVLLMSNCHEPEETMISRKQKNGSLQDVACPVPIAFYNKYMGGVDHADQMIGLYDLDRKSQKWWRKVFFRFLLTAVCNSYIIFCETNHKKIPYIQYFVNVAESMIEAGRSKVGRRKKTKRVGRHSASFRKMDTVGAGGDHLPLKNKSRRRCIRCTSRKVEKRTNYLCQRCNIPLCLECFSAYHS